MKEWLFEILVCPGCNGRFTRKDPEGIEKGIEHERLVCRVCENSYPVRGGIPRLCSDSYASSFSFEWNRFKRVQLDSVNGTDQSRKTFFEKTGLTPAALEGTTVLDAGCGAGRFLEVAARHAKRVVGVDMSRAVDAAKENLGALANIDFVQADIFQLPFGAVFDVVYSLGVLHHTPSTYEAFKRIARHVKPGGKLSIWIYSYTPISSELSALVRRVSTKIPEERLLRTVEKFTKGPGKFLYRISRVPVLRNIAGILPVSYHHDEQWRILDNFDWWSPRYQWKHTVGEVVGWFEQLGFKEITALPPKVAVSGRKPA